MRYRTACIIACTGEEASGGRLKSRRPALRFLAREFSARPWQVLKIALPHDSPVARGRGGLRAVKAAGPARADENL